MKLFTVADMVLAEQLADAAGHPYADMMEQAGRGLAQAIQTRFDVAGKTILVLVGPGNNGGDGLVAARYLAQSGATVSCYLYKPRAADDPNYSQLIELGLPVLNSADDAATLIERSDIIIDSLLGTGVTRPLGGALATALTQFSQAIVSRRTALQAETATTLQALTAPLSSPNAPALPVIAVDCPSGLNCDNGALDPLALPANLTVTFAGPKQGHFLFPGIAACGEIVVVDIGIAPAHEAHVATDVATARTIANRLPVRPLDGHKGTFGSTLVVGGSAEYLGAPILSARAAIRVGCGLVGLAVPKALRQLGAMQLPEATFPIMADEGVFSAESIPHITKRFPRTQALLIGPGLGRASDPFLAELLAQPGLPPLVIDADGLNYLAQQPNWWRSLPPNTILTPHPTEMGRLVGRDVRKEHRIILAREMAQRWGHVLVLKGAHTVVATPDGGATVIPIATPALAIAGSGDVLAGAIAGLLAQRITPADAALAGAYIHARAGLQLAQQRGPSGHLASEIAEALQSICHQLRQIA